ncbi:O-antigen ligase family protein [Methylomonas sp. AM2-LC]|uniref:O-antigen ligase family protein n=1 Tax=Methylomonas sp. AM2-LC TaxID=3153301 RepID=UPI0032675242
MNKSLFLILVVLVLGSLSAFIKNFCTLVGLPNILIVIRDPLLIATTLYGISKLNFFSSIKWGILISILCLFNIGYLLVAMYENKIYAGLYYQRSYMQPFLFFIGAYGVMQSQNKINLAKYLVKFMAWWNFLLFLCAIVIFLVLKNFPQYQHTFFAGESGDLLSSTWYISGGLWMRMGLPASGPNTLGLIFSLNIVVFSVLLIKHTKLYVHGVSNRILVTSLVIAIIGLILTFSRSSLLLVLFVLPILVFSGDIKSEKLLKILLTFLLIAVLSVVVGIVADTYSGGFIYRWIELNLSGKDPSMNGHMDSILYAINHFNEYVYFGYPRGTVGPKSIIFTGVFNHVENCFFGILMDMGVFIALLYILSVIMLFLIGYKTKEQIVLLLGFMLPCTLLPYVFEHELIIYFYFIYLTIGFLFKDKVAEDKSIPNKKYSYGVNIVYAK